MLMLPEPDLSKYRNSHEIDWEKFKSFMTDRNHIPADKILILALLLRVKNGTECALSQDRIAYATGFSPRYVRSRLKKLIAEGIMTVVKSKKLLWGATANSYNVGRFMKVREQNKTENQAL